MQLHAFFSSKLDKDVKTIENNKEISMCTLLRINDTILSYLLWIYFFIYKTNKTSATPI